jgi:hypothetical protein
MEIVNRFTVKFTGAENVVIQESIRVINIIELNID